MSKKLLTIILVIIAVIIMLAFWQNTASREKATQLFKERNDCWELVFGKLGYQKCLE